MAAKNDISNYIKKHKQAINLQLGNFSSLKQIGEGGNALVYSAELLEKKVALKILTKNEKTKKGRFKAEFFNTMQLPPNDYVVQYYDYDLIDIDDTNYPIIIMKYYDKSCKKMQVTDVNDLKVFVNYLLSAISFLHDNGVIHRDLKPENILIDKKGNYFLSDLGIAFFDKDSFPEFHETQKEERLGNYNFSAPECSTESNLIISETMDIYSVGQLIQWCVVGSTHKGTNRRRLSECPMENYDLEYLKMLDQIIDKAISNSPEERFQTIQEIIEFISEYEDKLSLVDPFNEMCKLQDMVLDSFPECCGKTICIDSELDLKKFFENINDNAFLNNSLWFTYGYGDNHIKKIKYLGNRWVLINTQELFIEKIWLRASSHIYDDVYIIQVKDNLDEIVPYKTYDGEETFEIFEINGEYKVDKKKCKSGRFKVKDEVVRLTDVKKEERERYNDKHYYFLGTIWSNVLQKTSNAEIDRIQNRKLEADLVEEFRKEIFYNRNDLVSERL